MSGISAAIITGQPGEDGARIYAESGVPSPTLGVPGDLYIDTDYNTYYQKIDSIWILKGNFGRLIRHFITITEDMATSKQLSLQMVPVDADSVQLTPVGGPLQILDIDFSVSGANISWDGLGLDGFLESGDQVQIFYRI